MSTSEITVIGRLVGDTFSDLAQPQISVRSFVLAVERERGPYNPYEGMLFYVHARDTVDGTYGLCATDRVMVRGTFSYIPDAETRYASDPARTTRLWIHATAVYKLKD